jgi:geranylgeranyl reductase family protein
VSNLPESFPVAIVGAGPAGAVLAYELATTGVRVLLLEKERLPRYKPCGGGVQARVVRRLGLDLQPVVRAAVDQLVFTYQLGRPVLRRARQPLIFMVMRDAFDAYLVERAARAGAEVRDRVRVDRVDWQEQGVLLTTSRGAVRTAVVVGADGANSRVAREAGLANGRDLDLALEGEFPAPAAARARWATTALLDLGSLPSGYGWLFPKGSGLSIGVGGPLPYRAQLRPYYERLLRWLGLEARDAERFSGHHLPLRRPGAPIVAHRTVLVGDAAGLVDPFTGEGLLGAVVSGQLAAEPVARAAAGDLAALQEYQRAIDRELMPELLEARVLLRVFDRMPRLAHWLMGHGQLAWRNLVRLLVGESDYRRLGGGSFRLAWHLLDRLLPVPAG